MNKINKLKHFSSPKPMVQLSFSNHQLSVVRQTFRLFLHFLLLLQLNTKNSYRKGNFKNKGHNHFVGEIIAKQ